MKPFHVHLIAYIAVNAVLLAINAAETPPEGEPIKWWAIWPLAGWGIGLAAHAFADWAQNRSREGQLLADEKIRGVAVHLFVYLAVNALLIGINLTYSPGNLWFIWPLLGWGIGLAGHAWLAYRAVLRKTMEHYATEQQVLTEMQLEAQAAEIAAAVEPPKKEKAPATRKRRKQAAAKTTKKRAARRGTATKRAPKKKPARKKS
ncbi:MAG: 2TM domain-containing protein [Alphaproteobacteria bacterium]